MEWFWRLSRVMLLLVICLPIVTPVGAAPANSIEILSQSVKSHFPDDLTFILQLRCDGGDIVDAALYYQVGWETGQRIGRPEPFTPAAEVTLTATWDTRAETVPPFMEVVYYWQIVDSAGNRYETSPVSVDYVDASHDWQTRSNEHVAVYWYDQSEEFGATLFEAATEGYDHVASVVGMTTERADRPPFSPDDAAAELRRLESGGVLEPRASSAVLVAAGHGEPRAPSGKRPRHPGGLTRREVDVLQLAAKGLTTRQIAERLVISPKTADHHIQHIYGKIGVSTRAGAALWAMQHSMVQ